MYDGWKLSQSEDYAGDRVQLCYRSSKSGHADLLCVRLRGSAKAKAKWCGTHDVAVPCVKSRSGG